MTAKLNILRQKFCMMKCKKPKYILCQHNHKKEFLQAAKTTFMWCFFIYIAVLYFFNVQLSPKFLPTSYDLSEQFYMSCNFANQTTVTGFYNLMNNKVDAENKLKKWISLQAASLVLFKRAIRLKPYQEAYNKINAEYEYQRNLWIKCTEINYEIALSKIKLSKEDVIFWMKTEIIIFIFFSNFLRIFLKSQRRLIFKCLTIYLFVFPICLCMIPLIHNIAKLSYKEESVKTSLISSFIYQCLFNN